MSPRSTQLTEAIYAYQAGEVLALEKDNPWSSYLSSLRLPQQKYFDTMTDVLKSHSGFVEPVSQDNSNDFRKFKHYVRWTIYQKRWGKPGDNICSPTLSSEEREAFLKTLSSGRLSTLDEVL